MRDALYSNGVFDEVLREIIAVQQVLPDQGLFLQPYSDSPIAQVAADPPSGDEPIQLFISTTADLGNVRYEGQVVGWFDKRTASAALSSVCNTLIRMFQPGEKNLYDKGVNVLVVRRLVSVPPFPVQDLIVCSTGLPMESAQPRADGSTCGLGNGSPTPSHLPTGGQLTESLASLALRIHRDLGRCLDRVEGAFCVDSPHWLNRASLVMDEIVFSMEDRVGSKDFQLAAREARRQQQLGRRQLTARRTEQPRAERW